MTPVGGNPLRPPMHLPEDLITERGRVIRVENGTAWVHCESQSGCARCAAGQGCGGGLFAKLLRARLQELPVRTDPVFQGRLVPGDWVLIGLSVAAVQTASLLLYGLPLAGLLAGVVAGSGISPGNDLAALAGAVTGFIAGLGLAQWQGKRFAARARLEPVLLRQLSPDEPCPPPAEARQ